MAIGWCYAWALAVEMWLKTLLIMPMYSRSGGRRVESETTTGVME